MFRMIATQHQPFAPGGEANPKFDAEKFEKWATLARDTVKMLAPYQTPQLRSIGVNFELVKNRTGRDEDEPVRYPTRKEIRRELALKDTRTSSARASRAHLKHSSAIARYSAAVFMGDAPLQRDSLRVACQS